jgi:hypothetical protein
MALMVDWESSPRIIYILAPTTDITVQNLSNQIKDFEDEPASLSFPKLILTFGKQALGGGAFVGITAVLQNAKIAFEARTGGGDDIQCTVTSGNLVALDENGTPINPVYPTEGTQVVIQQSTSPSIATPPSDYSLMYLVESLRGGHTALGNIWYWDPSSGSDTNDGTTPSTAVATFAKVQNLSSAAGGVNDIVFALATHSSGLTTVTNEVINITATTPGLKLRGPGYSFQLKPASAGSDVINVSANGVEVSGFYIEPKAGVGNSDNGITITGDNALIKDCWVNSATANGIDVSSSSRTVIDTCAIESSANYGISLGTGTSLSAIRNCLITGNSQGVYMTGTSITDNILENNVIYNNTNSGINIVDSTVVRTGIRLHHTFAGNGENITDNGTGTFQDTSGAVEQGDIDNIVAGVWNEVITTGYTTSGSAAKVLKDTKTRATLASLK